MMTFLSERRMENTCMLVKKLWQNRSEIVRYSVLYSMNLRNTCPLMSRHRWSRLSTVKDNSSEKEKKLSNPSSIRKDRLRVLPKSFWISWMRLITKINNYQMRITFRTLMQETLTHRLLLMKGKFTRNSNKFSKFWMSIILLKTSRMKS